ncbi:Pc16g00970 [Talaromyces islandicus]|uniref:Pc16g00970 n=1 Tax=Talaromyces islandicus TaxID=28573 RepID=A0A0U1M3F1_TALIS|nr:Pc16g00970 [Talaromyces islandicus]
MHISEPDDDVLAVSTAAAALKKRKRDGALWNQENIQNIEGDLSPYQLDYQDINMLAPTPRFIPDSSSSRPQWLHLQQNGTAPAMQKKRRILQPQSNRQPQCLRPHSGSHSQAQANTDNQNTKKSSLPTLTIPSFSNHHDPSFLSTPGCDEDLVSPRTTTATTAALLIPPPVLRPCHVCHRKPSTKVMLDAYADCELCGQRACYICLRECNSINCGAISSLPETPNEYRGEDYDMDIRRDDGYLNTTTHYQQTPTLHNQSNATPEKKLSGV